VVALGEVRAQDGDDHVGAADGLGGEARVEDVRTDQDLGLAYGWDGRGGAVDGPDLVAALGGEVDDVGADSAGGPEDGDVHDQLTPLVRAAAALAAMGGRGH
jgi:hypothetical protein